MKSTKCKAPIARKSTMVDQPNSKKGSSPMLLSKFSAAFKPFKKRSLSVAGPSSTEINGEEGIKKRDKKAIRKLEEAV